jgi:hypothetical protein
MAVRISAVGIKNHLLRSSGNLMNAEIAERRNDEPKAVEYYLVALKVLKNVPAANGTGILSGAC